MADRLRGGYPGDYPLFVMSTLEELGPKAEAAVPMLEEIVRKDHRHGEKPRYRERAYQALKAIAPKTASKLRKQFPEIRQENTD